MARHERSRMVRSAAVKPFNAFYPNGPGRARALAPSARPGGLPARRTPKGHDIQAGRPDFHLGLHRPRRVALQRGSNPLGGAREARHERNHVNGHAQPDCEEQKRHDRHCQHIHALTLPVASRLGLPAGAPRRRDPARDRSKCQSSRLPSCKPPPARCRPPLARTATSGWRENRPPQSSVTVLWSQPVLFV
jgi:hypothetical protein